MSKKQAVAGAEEKSNVPAVVQAQLPAYLQGYTGPTGAEDIDVEDVTLPRIKIGQDMTPAVQNGDLERGDIYLNVANEKLVGPGEKLPFVILARNKEHILWRPRKDGGGILARARPVQTTEGKRYEWDKPNTEFDVKVDGKIKVTWKTKNYIDQDGLDKFGSEIPGNKDSGIAATAHHNYVVYLPTLGMLAAFSLSRSQVRVAKDLNETLKRRRDVPIWARAFTVKTVDESKDGNEYKNFEIRPAGFVPDAEFQQYAKLAEKFFGNKFTVDQSDGGDESSETNGAL